MSFWILSFAVGTAILLVFKRGKKKAPKATEDPPLPNRARDPQFDRLYKQPLSDNRISTDTTTKNEEPQNITQQRTKAPLMHSDDDILNQTFRFIALDVETANSDTSSICQLGLALVTSSGRIHTLSFFIDPEAPFASFNSELHGIDATTVRGHPPFNQVIQALRAFLERHPLVQHSGFDKRAVEGACKRYKLPIPRLTWHDSVTIARQAWPELKGNGGHGLAKLKDHLGLDFEHHDAAEDAKAAAQVVLLAEQVTGKAYEDLAKGSQRKGKSADYPKSVSLDGNQNGPLYGHAACFTGQLSISRSEAATIAAGAGITVKTGVSKKVTLLVVGDQDLSLLNGHEKSTKHRKAEELIESGHDIKIIGESDFLKLVTP